MALCCGLISRESGRNNTEFRGAVTAISRT